MNDKTMIFFDIDGTLLDHKGAEKDGVEIFYKKNGFEELCDFLTFYEIWVRFSDKYFEKFLKKECSFEEQRAMRIIEVYKKFGKEIDYDDALDKFKDYLEAYEDSWKAYDDVLPCLEALKGYKLGVISNGEFEQQMRKLKKMDVDGYFADVVTAGEVGVAKPDTRIFEIACERNNVDVKECYYVGDNVKTDILPCEKIGMKAVLIDREVKRQENINVISCLTNLIKELS